jgi:hypothetical protein
VADTDYGVDYRNLCIVNGYADNEEKWISNSRVQELEMYFNDKYICKLKLIDTIKPQYIDISGLKLSAESGEEIRFRFVITDVYEGEKYTDTAITGIEMQFWTPNH